MVQQDRYARIYGIDHVLFEPEIDRTASQYIEENYETIVETSYKMGIDPTKAYDLVNDVYLSIVKAENIGEGYDMTKGRHEDYISVETFVYARLKGYSKNEKYNHIDKFKFKNKENNRTNITLIPSSACYDVSDTDEASSGEKLDYFQMAFVIAADELNYSELVDENESILEQIEFCCSFSDRVGFNILSMLKNINKAKDDILKNGLKNQSFGKLKEAAKYHDEFGEALKGVLNYACNYRDEYQKIIQAL